jgi:hypothetical protein
LLGVSCMAGKFAASGGRSSSCELAVCGRVILILIFSSGGIGDIQTDNQVWKNEWKRLASSFSLKTESSPMLWFNSSNMLISSISPSSRSSAAPAAAGSGASGGVLGSTVMGVGCFSVVCLRHMRFLPNFLRAYSYIWR